MSYNPTNLVPPENPHAIWCDYCGDQVLFDDEAEFVCLLHSVVLHTDCLQGYAEGLQHEIDRLGDVISAMVERDLS